MRRSKFNLSHYRLMSGRMGELLPASCMEVLPGDTFRMRSTSLLRLSPMVAPVMHPIFLRCHTFFVPNRLVFEEWEDFIVDMNTTLTIPQFAAANSEGSIMDYLGVAPGDYTNNPVNSMPLRAVNLIWNEFYRDQDLDTERDLDDNSLPRVRWGKDYFTTAREEAQSGATETVDIEFDQAEYPVITAGQYPTLQQVTSPDAGGSVFINNDLASGELRVQFGTGGVTGSMDINEWRRAMAWQRLAEHRNKYGSRYTDYLAFLGVHAKDQRLQRPEFLGGGSKAVSISEVLSTADTLNDVQQGSELGTLAGHGIAGHGTKPLKFFAQEHGHLITLCSVRPLSIYTNALHRNWLREKPEDYWQKEMEIMGDQPVLKGEVSSTATNFREPFGYVGRHRDYREQFSGVAGEMRDQLDYWHLGRTFTGDPQLNTSFVECVPTERIFANTITDTFQLMASHKVVARRLVSKRERV